MFIDYDEARVLGRQDCFVYGRVVSVYKRADRIARIDDVYDVAVINSLDPVFECESTDLALVDKIEELIYF